MSATNRSIRLVGRTSTSLNGTAASTGEIFYDITNQTLRIFNGTQVGGTTLANRTWVTGQLLSNIDYNNLLNKPVPPVLSAVATSGSYNDLSNRPLIFSGSYNDLTDVPVTPTASTTVLGLVKVDGTTITINNGVISSVGGGGGGGGGGADISASSINALADVDTVTQAPTTSSYLKWNGLNWVPAAVTAATVGLGNVTNESKATMFTSPTFTGTVALPAGTTIGGSNVASTGNITFLNNSISTTSGNISIARTTSFSQGINVTGSIGASINALSDVDTTTTPPTNGQVLKWNGTNWVPGIDATSGGGGSNADTLDGLDSTYFLDYNNLANRPDLTNITGATLTNTTFSGIVNGLSAAAVGLDQVANESKATMFTTPTFTGNTITFLSRSLTGFTGTGGVLVTSASPTISNPTFSGTVTGLTISAADVGLGNVTNESKTTMFNNPTFTGTVSGVSKGAVGLGNVENTALSTWAGSTSITTIGSLTTNVQTTGSIRSSSNTSGIGYSTGAGGVVTQGTNRTTTVTLNRICGTITLSAASQAANSTFTFTVNNSTVASSDTVIVSTANSPNNYVYWPWVTRVATGSFNITVYVLSGAPNAEQPTINFAVIKSVTG